MSADFRSVAAPDLAVDDRRLQRLFGPMIRRRNRRIDQEQEPFRSMLVEVLGEAVVGLVGSRSLRQIAQPVDELLVRDGANVLGRSLVGERVVGEPVATVKSLGEQIDHRLRKTPIGSRLRFQKRLRTPQRMVDALLMGCVLEAIVGRVAVMSHAAGPVDADDVFEDVGTSLRVDAIQGGPVVADPGVEPDGSPSEAPAGFVRGDVAGSDELLGDLFVSRFEASGRAGDDLRGGAASDLDAEALVEEVGDLAVRQSGPLVEIDDGGLGVGTDLAGGGAGRVGGLQGMSAATGLAAASAFSAVDGEAATDRLARDFFLMDRVGVSLFDISAALGAGVGKLAVENLVDRRGIGRGPMTVGAVLIAGFATWLSRLLLGRAFGERSGLAFGVPFDGLEPSHELGEAFLERSRLFSKPFLEFNAAGTTLTGEVIHARQRSDTSSPQLRGFSRSPASQCREG
jgi:hypothetical protein